MIGFRTLGRVLLVDAPDPDAVTRPRLSIVVDRRNVLDSTDIDATEKGWRVQLPESLFDGKPHRVALDMIADERSLERTAFSFAASTRPVSLARRD